MSKINKRKLTLDRPATYQIKIPGVLDESSTIWDIGFAIKVEGDREGQPVTCMTSTFDQAGLHGLLRRVYSMGLPLISVIWLE